MNFSHYFFCFYLFLYLEFYGLFFCALPSVFAVKVRRKNIGFSFLTTTHTFREREKRKTKVFVLRSILNGGRKRKTFVRCKKEEEELLKRNGENEKETNMLSTGEDGAEQSVFPLNMNWIKVINLISQSNDVEALTLAFNGALSAAEKKGCLTTVLELFETMKRKNIKPDLVSYKLILSLCEKYHLSENAEVLFEEMIETDKILPNYEIYSIMISCFAKRGYVDKAIEYFEKMRNDPLIEEKRKMNTSVDTNRMEKWKKEEQSVFPEKESTLEPEKEHVYNKQFSEISSQIKKIEKNNTKIQYGEYANIIFACNIGNAHREGIKYFEELLNSGNYIPSVFVFENIFDLLGKNGNYEKASEYYNLLKHDPTLKTNISVNILNNMLKSLSIYSKLNIIEHVWNNEFDELSLSPNDVSYQLMLKVYSDTDSYEKAFKLFKEMQIKKMLTKTNVLPFLYTINSFKNCGIFNYAIYVLRIAKFLDMANDDLILLYNNTMVVCVNAKRYDVIISLYAELIKFQQKDVSLHLNINTLSFVLLAFKELNMKEDFKSLKNMIVQKNYKLTPLCVKLFDEVEKENNE